MTQPYRAGKHKSYLTNKAKHNGYKLITQMDKWGFYYEIEGDRDFTYANLDDVHTRLTLLENRRKGTPATNEEAKNAI